ncbi:hypothetical protein QFC20_001261 [Naganishia adeliensis]|uniref:Uncharacterized protein n=1 Tax=Naganishia adeliensis TaxID=92952 RepID=A0ACC2WUT1_9TREE|nr:hypothetical protein QFC20_001261 [Naganishia adeliensis]
MVLVGIGTEDTARDREYIVRKILSTRFFDGPSPAASAELVEDDGLKERQKSLAWRASVKDIEGEVLFSQFTLMAKVEKGSKPDGKFGAMMQVSLCNDGPVTITIDSKAKSPSAAPSKSNTPSVSGTTTPSRPEGSKTQLSFAEKKAKKANAAKAFAQQSQVSDKQSTLPLREQEPEHSISS